MINIDEKRALTNSDREYIIHVFDTGYQKQEPLSLHLSIFDEFEITRQERNAIILESDYALDEDLVATLVLFG